MDDEIRESKAENEDNQNSITVAPSAVDDVDTEVRQRSKASNGVKEENKSRKPGNTAFKQQRLPAWQPILTAGTVLPMFFLVGILFIPLGVGFLVTSSNVKEKIIDYTECKMYNDKERYCHEVVANYTGDTCRCRVEFELDEIFPDPVYIYYRLTNYYQNHRRYVNSRDDLQLLGKNVKEPSADCEPYRFHETIDENNETIKTAYAPCGAIANSMFNDTLSFEFGYDDYNRTEGVTLNFEGIAWPSDVDGKFKNPPDGDFSGTVPPPNWQINITELPGQFLNESFIVWMRTSAFPSFRKLHSKVVVEPDTVLDEGLPAGKYYLHVDYKYPVTMFDGTKSVVISTASWLGGKNNFLGIAYLVTGSICILFGAIFLCIHVKYGQKTSFSSRSDGNTVITYDVQTDVVTDPL